MTSYERMYALLRSTGLYRLDGDSAVEIELRRYAHYLDELEERIARLPDAAFAETADEAGLAAWRRMLSLSESIGAEELREVVRHRLAISNRDFTIEGVKRCMSSGGFTVELTEDFANDTVTVEIRSDLGLFGSKAEKEAFLQRCLPCHVQGVFIWQ